MSRPINRLTARQVASLKEVGRHADGGGLYLRITASGSRSWIFMAVIAGKRAEIGLGPVRNVTLATARSLAGSMREATALGDDPRAVIVKALPDSAPAVTTFGKFAEDYISSVEAGWKNAAHRHQWRQSLRDHARALSDMPIDEVDTDTVLSVLRPIWMLKAETASRLRGRIEKVLDAAKARGLRPRDSLNPAMLRGHLALLLPKQSGMARGHHRALPYHDAPAFWVQLKGRQALAARCLEFTILTAARSGEALEASWGEIDLEHRLWTVPAARMKAGKEHVVPLSAPAMDLLKMLKPEKPEAASKIFSIGGATRSNMAMSMLLRRIGVDATVHGFRSTFRDWAGDASAFPREVVEQALAHTIANKAERAYRRGTAVERRRGLMESWAAYLGS